MKIIISSNVKLVKSSSGKKVIKLSKSAWEDIGIQSGWLKREAMLEAIPMTCVQTLVASWLPKIIKEIKNLSIIEHADVSKSNEITQAAHDFEHYVEYVSSYIPFLVKDKNYAKKIGSDAIDKIMKLKNIFKKNSINVVSLEDVLPILYKVNTFVRQNQDRTSSNNNDFPRDPRREFNPNADISNVKAVSSMIRSIILQMNSMVSNYNNKGYFLTDSTKNCRDYLDRIAKEYVMTPFDINYYYRYTEKIDRNINKPDFVLQLVDAMVSGLEYTISECEKFKKSKNSKRQ